SMRVLATSVEERGGGLLITGGPSSFGQGGYHRSPLDPLLPVSMELRPEQRRGSLAMVIAMDRSGSMAAPTADGRTKMALAAEGAVAALQLLGPGDEAGVWVVDEKAHRIVELMPIEDVPLGKVASITSQGGGIYVYEALEATAFEIDQSRKATRHIVLFSDAADSEEPGAYQQLLADLAKKKITVSVIGLGRQSDSDGALLEDIARRGGGRIYFTRPAAAPLRAGDHPRRARRLRRRADRALAGG
ncbi:MAG: VWA domain-containing protein, partial [Myxococcales bacterium]